MNTRASEEAGEDDEDDDGGGNEEPGEPDAKGKPKPVKKPAAKR